MLINSGTVLVRISPAVICSLVCVCCVGTCVVFRGPRNVITHVPLSNHRHSENMEQFHHYRALPSRGQFSPLRGLALRSARTQLEAQLCDLKAE